MVQSSPGASVRVMAGSHGGVSGPIQMRNPGLLMDVRLDPGASFTQEVPTVGAEAGGGAEGVAGKGWWGVCGEG